MVIVIGIVIIIIIIIGWLLLGWITFTVDTDQADYSLKALGLFKGSIILKHDDVHLLLAAPFFQKRIELVNLLLNDQKEDKWKDGAPKKGRKRKSKDPFSRRVRKRIIPLLKSFRTERFYANIDTDDPVLNAKLYPFAFLAQRRGIPLFFNFQGRQSVHLVIRNRLANVLWALYV